MKKKIAYLLTACLISQLMISSVLPVGAGEMNSDIQSSDTQTVQEQLEENESIFSEEEISTEDEQEESQNQDEGEAPQTDSQLSDSQEEHQLPESIPENNTTESLEQNEENDTNALGGIEVSLFAALPREGKTDFRVILDGPESREAVLNLEQDQNKEMILQDQAIFNDLKPGTYQIKIVGSQFADYEQEIEVKNLIYQIQVFTDFTAGFDFQQDKEHPGVILVGDVNNDGVLNQNDQDKLIETLESSSYDDICDLNQDGIVDLIDLQYFAAHYKTEMDSVSLIQTCIPGTLAATETENITVVGGDQQLENLFNDSEKTVELKPGKGGEISNENPILLHFGFEHAKDPVLMEGMTLQSPLESDGSLSEGTVLVTYEKDGKEYTEEIPFGKAMLRARSGQVTQGEDGKLIIDFGGQIAVKKVTIKITGTEGGTLAEISKVEFLNDMENRIPAPQMDIPENLTVVPGNKTLTLSWKKSQNVTGYEVSISYNGKEETYKTAATSITIDSFQNEKLVNKEKYLLKVQAINGSWKSGYSQPVTGIPVTNKKPDAPDNVVATGGYKSVSLSWKKMSDTDFYRIYYKKAEANNFQMIDGVTGTNYTLSGLEDNTKYVLYLTGVNDLGESGKSIEATATTLNLIPAQLPEYKKINTSNGTGVLTEHILNARFLRGGVGWMINSPLDQAVDPDGSKKSALGAVDDSYASVYHIDDWDDGVVTNDPNRGLVITLDDFYQMQYITFAEDTDRSAFGETYIYWWDENGQRHVDKNTEIVQKTSSNGRKYYLVTLSKPITTNQIQISSKRAWTYRSYDIAEVGLYYYDSLEDEINQLYADDLHVTLKENVTADTIQTLKDRLNTKDEISGEYHPKKSQLEKELENAERILNEKDLGDTISVFTEITTQKDGHLGITGLNAWQPLGISAYEGEELTIYVGSNTLKTGEKTNLELVATQFHGESNKFSTTITRLQVGRNEITIPNLVSLNTERGGALYLQYTGNNSKEQFAVRVSGGTKIPVLNLYGITDQEKRQELIESYISELKTYTAQLKKRQQQYRSEGLAAADYDYDEQNCILNTTDIMLDQMMLSLPASQVLNGLGNDSSKQVQKLSDSMDAMDQMMELFYHQKGLSDQPEAGAKNALPVKHLNIRYMRMFAGAFMYAAGNHIGIEWGSTPDMMSGVPVTSDENGKYISGQYFGWGIAHEIGHQINQSAYAIAEITNNYFSILAQSKDTNDSVRFSYDDVYEKVTSNTIGRSGNVFTQLGMYWQLHLAYDRDYNYKIYDSYEEQFNNLFYARVDSYARNVSSAPKPNGIALTLGSSADQNIFRLACAAAEKDLSDFFARWGILPDETTSAYISQFEKEDRAIYYVNDEARVYEMENGTDSSVKGKAVVGKDSSLSIDPATPNVVTLHLQNTASVKEAVLGYEITRITISSGKEESQVVGFTTENTFVDQVSSLNNRTVIYQITVIDKFLNRSEPFRLDPVKIYGDGSQEKENWKISTNMKSDEDHQGEGTAVDPCVPKEESAVSKVIDSDYQNTYTGKTSGEDPEIILSFGKSIEVTALKYQVLEGDPIKQYEIQLSEDGVTWKTVKEGTFSFQNGADTVYFQNENQDPWVCTYDASYLKLIAKGQGKKELSIAELDVFGPSGDNVELYEDGIGRLAEDYTYGDREEDYIPKGSIVFTGTYRGNPAYNVVLLYDENGAIIGGIGEDGSLNAHQIILADVPEKGELGNVSDGKWVYWIEPKDQVKLSGTVRAELYRVDNALTNEGQRLVSDTLFTDIPSNLPDLVIQ